MAAISADNHGLRLVVRYAVLVLIAIIFIFPLIFMLMSSLKPDQQLLTDTASIRAFLPVGDISLNNYHAAFDRAPVALFVFNSVLVTGVTVLMSLLTCSLAAFAFVFIGWQGRDFLLAVIIATVVVPFETFAIPLLLIAHSRQMSCPLPPRVEIKQLRQNSSPQNSQMSSACWSRAT